MMPVALLPVLIMMLPSCEKTPGTSGSAFTDAVDLSEKETANCYIVSGSGTYQFKTVKGNSSQSVGNAVSADVLWESFGTDTAPAPGDLVKDVKCSGSYICFSTASSFREGNAVIAARDASGNILWSWHVWLTDRPADQVYRNDAGVMMDRNLGALSSEKGKAESMGLYYQRGRKDPFPSASSISEDVQSLSSAQWPDFVISDSGTGTMEYAVAHPMTFIRSNNLNADWYYTGSSAVNAQLWGSEKTMYDPCPAGYRVPDGGKNGIWAKAMGLDESGRMEYDTVNYGYDFGGSSPYRMTDDPMCWYPSAGFTTYVDGLPIHYIGEYGRYWSCTVANGNASFELFTDKYGNITMGSCTHGIGGSVRCQKI